MATQVLAQSRLRVLKRPELEKLVIALADELLSYTVVTPEDEDPCHERQVETAEEASEQGLQALAMAIDPTHDYVGMEEEEG